MLTSGTLSYQVTFNYCQIVPNCQYLVNIKVAVRASLLITLINCHNCHSL